MDMDFLLEWGLWGLFLVALLAATVLPMGSEWLMLGLIALGEPVWPVLWVATAGNVLGAIGNYALGAWASQGWLQRVFSLSDQELEKATQRFRRHGHWVLCFAWVPLIGDPLTVVAGILRISIPWFIALVFLGKFARYAAVVWLGDTVM